jgi:serine/threonine protein kinase
MPRLPQPGNIINGYTITEQINAGAMANSFSAEAPDGKKVFFKQYKSPTVAVDWYSDYIKYNQELNRRIGDPNLQRFCVRNVASFEVKFGVTTFFQVYEFVEGGHDLGTILENIKKHPKLVSWDQRLIMGKVIMASINALHAAKVVHADLKPPNIQMIKDATIKAGYQPKLIDMDRSVLADQLAPWHGHESYVGTPGYFSPEHIAGKIPKPASDVFTCGLILYELLAQGYPFPIASDEDYRSAVRKDDPPDPELLGALPDEAATLILKKTLRRCLSLDDSVRPTALEVAKALNGQARPAAEPKEPTTPPPLEPTKPTLVLKGPTGSEIRLNIRTEMGKHLLRQASLEAIRADYQQFVVFPDGEDWWIEPNSGSHAWTTLNSLPLESKRMLAEGDKIALQGRKTGTTAMPLTVAFE